MRGGVLVHLGRGDCSSVRVRVRVCGRFCVSAGFGMSVSVYVGGADHR